MNEGKVALDLSYLLVAHKEQQQQKAWNKLSFFHFFCLFVLLIQSKTCGSLWICMAMVLV